MHPPRVSQAITMADKGTISVLMGVKEGVIFSQRKRETVNVCLVSDPLQEPIIIQLHQFETVMEVVLKNICLSTQINYRGWYDKLLSYHSLGKVPAKRGRPAFELVVLTFELDCHPMMYIGPSLFSQPSSALPCPLDQLTFTCCQDHQNSPTSFEGYCESIKPIGFRLDPFKDNLFKLWKKMDYLYLNYT